MLDRVEARAPCRVDLAGGTLDIWPLGLLHPGARTVNVAIDVEVAAVLSRRQRGWVVATEGTRIEVESRDQLLRSPDSALVGQVALALEIEAAEVALESASPRGAGLGASSALAVALIAAGERMVGREPSTVEETVHLARDLEARLMGLPTGVQDHYPALLGGVLEIRMEPGGERVRRLDVDLDELGRCLVVAYSGGSHLSAANNFEVVARRLSGDAATTERLGRIAAAAAATAAALDRGDLAAVGGLMSAEWEARRGLAPVVPTDAIERILEVGTAAGAWGGKVCGAGGGGCVALLAPPSRREAVVAAVRALGYPVLPCSPTAAPLRLF